MAYLGETAWAQGKTSVTWLDHSRADGILKNLHPEDARFIHYEHVMGWHLDTNSHCVLCLDPTLDMDPPHWEHEASRTSR